MPKLVIISRPITESSLAYILLENDDRFLEKYLLEQGKPISIRVVDESKKRCVGWYDVATHTNHLCDGARKVDLKYESCFECRKKTGFNPAFYNASEVSTVQQDYNKKPHSVYVSYFGDGLVKAGIMSDSRGLERIYEQGALLYCVVDRFEDATKAHNLESQLIKRGLKNSVTKRQKEKVLSNSLELEVEKKKFFEILKELGLGDKKVISNLDQFFFGDYPKEGIKLIGDNPFTGKIRGVVGRYLVLSNNDYLYGVWLSDLFGFEIELEEKVRMIEAEPKQVSLF